MPNQPFSPCRHFTLASLNKCGAGRIAYLDCGPQCALYDPDPDPDPDPDSRDDDERMAWGRIACHEES